MHSLEQIRVDVIGDGDAKLLCFALLKGCQHATHLVSMQSRTAFGRAVLLQFRL